MAHTVQAPASWPVPTGRNMAPGNYIIEETLAGEPQAHYDTLGAMSQMVNNLYEVYKPALIMDSWVEPRLFQSTDYTLVGRYKIPAEHIGTGLVATDPEKLAGEMYMSQADPVDTASVRVTSYCAGVTAGIATAGYEWVDICSTQDVEVDDALDSGDDPEVTVEVCTPVLSDVYVDALWLGWDISRALLPSALCDNGFVACDIAQFSTEQYPLNVEMMRRLLANLDGLIRRRTPGMIVTHWWETVNTSKMSGGTSDTKMRLIANQHQLTDCARFWFYGQGGSADKGLPPLQYPENWLRVTVGPVGGPVTYTGELHNLSHEAQGWHLLDIPIDPPGVDSPREWEITVRESGVDLQGICAWWRAVRGAVK